MTSIAFDSRAFAVTRPRRSVRTVVSRMASKAERSFAPVAALASRINQNEALNYAENRIALIRESASIDSDAQQRLIGSLRGALLADSIFPSITTDGFDGLAAQWVLGRRRLVLEMGSDGEYTFIETDDTGRLTRNEIGEERPDLSHFQDAIRAFTMAVVSENPGWRSNFA